MSQTLMGEQLASAYELRSSLYDAAPEDMRLLLVSPRATDALWTAVWALEDSLSAVRRIQALPTPPPYAVETVEQIESKLNLLRDLLHTL
jgi:hypothetical protein